MKLGTPSPAEIAPPEILERLARLYGPPWSLDDRGVVCAINPRWWAGLFQIENHVIFCQLEGFWFWDEVEGIYVSASADCLRERIADLIRRIAGEHSIPGLARQIKISTLTNIGLHLRGIAEVQNPFEDSKGILAVENGVLVMARGQVRFQRFSPSFRVRDRIRVRYDSTATSPRYDQEFLGTVLDTEDIDLLHRQSGLILAGVNPSHRLGILEGSSGGGKSSFLKILTELVGVSRTMELRTEHLDKPFEMSSFRGKTFLSASDVGSEFLCTPGAHTLKGLVSDDLFNPESKNSNERRPMRGPFGVLIATNCKLVYRSQGDADAWRRRLIIYQWAEPPKDRKKTIEFTQELLRTEGSGILNHFLDGYRRAWVQLTSIGDMVLSVPQQERVEALVMRSEALETFVLERLELDSEADVTAEELLVAFVEWCLVKGWIPPSERIIHARIGELILRHYGRPKSHSLERDGKKGLRGWRGLKLLDDGTRSFMPA